MRFRFTFAALVVMALHAAPASAQTYVAAVLGADLAKTYEYSTDGTRASQPARPVAG